MITFGKFDIKNFEGALIVTDDYLEAHYGVKGNNCFVLPCGEEAKSFYWAEKLCRWFLSKNLAKDGKVAAVGGGSVGDAVGFAASIYKRGVPLTLVPTTFLSQIDSSVGGKTAIDLNGVKNAVGTFIKADTFIDCRFLETLSDRQWTDGMGELFKYRMLNAAVDRLAEKERPVEEIVRACVEYKQKITGKDFYDNSLRRCLNMGHTTAHALELQYGMPHGAAVLAGLYYETAISRKSGFLSAAETEKRQREIEKLIEIPEVTGETIKLMSQDKKNRGGKIRFILPGQRYGFVTADFTESQTAELFGGAHGLKI